MASAKTKPVLVAIMNNLRDFAIARDEHWYRIPVRNAPKNIEEIEYLAFYQTKVFREEKWAVNYFAKVKGIATVKRVDLFPEKRQHPRAHEQYYKLEIDSLKRLPRPIVSQRWRRIVFISTTYDKLMRAEEINDLFHESPLEEKFYDRLKKEKIEAERQFYIGEGKVNYCLDFALFCKKGKLDVECDGDTWHCRKEQIPDDNLRDNFLTSRGWSVLRFSSKQINANMPECINTVKRTISKCGGLVRQQRLSEEYATEEDDRTEH
ncbi:MAG: endonuclease domain-containing protein [bacterium]